jgi:hypothetical protein
MTQSRPLAQSLQYFRRFPQRSGSSEIVSSRKDSRRPGKVTFERLSVRDNVFSRCGVILAAVTMTRKILAPTNPVSPILYRETQMLRAADSTVSSQSRNGHIQYFCLPCLIVNSLLEMNRQMMRNHRTLAELCFRRSSHVVTRPQGKRDKNLMLRLFVRKHTQCVHRN